MALEINRIEALCFDIDGTLRDTDDQYVARLELLLSPLRIFLSVEKVSSFSRWLIMKAETPGNILMNIQDILGLDEIFFKDKAHNKSDIRTKKMKMVPGSKEVIISLSEKYKLAIASARRKNKVDQFIKQNNLIYLFPVVVSALTTRRSKPHPAPILFASKKLGVRPENILMIGDTTFDILSGKRAGAQTVAVLTGFGELKELQRAGADLIINSVSELPSILLP